MRENRKYITYRNGVREDNTRRNCCSSVVAWSLRYASGRTDRHAHHNTSYVQNVTGIRWRVDCRINETTNAESSLHFIKGPGESFPGPLLDSDNTFTQQLSTAASYTIRVPHPSDPWLRSRPPTRPRQRPESNCMLYNCLEWYK